jgi:lysophospholipase L1-like esterase
VLRHASLGLFLLGLASCTRKDTPQEARPGSPAVSSVGIATPPAPAITTVSAKAPATAVTPKAAERVRYVGRFAPDESGRGTRFAWSGSGMIVRLSGKGLSVRLRDEGKHALNSFQVVVDGEAKSVLKMQKGKELYPVVTDLPDGVHEIALYKRTEADVGEVVLLGLVPDGELLAPPPAPDRRIELIGDSITTGYGNEGKGPKCTFKPQEQNEYLTYGAIAARELGADHTTIAWSGKTLYSMREYFPRALPAREDSTWDYARYQPHLVVINVGTNNFAMRDPGEARFTSLYTELHARVRSAYPEAYIACALGPMLTDVYPEGRKNLTQARKYMRAVVAKLKQNDPMLDLLEFPEQRHADGLGCGFHPGLKTHKLMADRLVAFARERLGW